jgi:hypothetical protein
MPDNDFTVSGVLGVLVFLIRNIGIFWVLFSSKSVFARTFMLGFSLSVEKHNGLTDV